MSPTDSMTLMLLVAHFLALGVALMAFGWMFFLQRRRRATEIARPPAKDFFTPQPVVETRPATWLAIRTLEPKIIRAALADQSGFLISPRINGWVIVTGPGLPDPGDDVDECFRFLTAASRQLGHVQFFHMEKFSTHHAWVRMDEGCVTRAYAWAGSTVWNQGAKTRAESGLGLKCFDYGDDSEKEPWLTKEAAAMNVEKIPLLAARWSVDPRVLHRADDIAGGPPRLY